jgi:hypothetical protein
VLFHLILVQDFTEKKGILVQHLANYSNLRFDHNKFTKAVKGKNVDYNKIYCKEFDRMAEFYYLSLMKSEYLEYKFYKDLFSECGKTIKEMYEDPTLSSNVKTQIENIMSFMQHFEDYGILNIFSDHGEKNEKPVNESQKKST